MRGLCSYIESNEGQFLKCSSEAINDLIKQESIGYELGLNRMYLEQQIKKMLDPHEILINSNYENIDL